MFLFHINNNLIQCTGDIWQVKGRHSVMWLLIVDIVHLAEAYETAHKKSGEGNLEFHDSEDVTKICPYLHEFIFGVVLALISNILKLFPKTTIEMIAHDDAANAIEELQRALARLQVLASDNSNQRDIFVTLNVFIMDWKGDQRSSKDMEMPHLHASEVAIVHRYLHFQPIADGTALRTFTTNISPSSNHLHSTPLH